MEINTDVKLDKILLTAIDLALTFWPKVRSNTTNEFSIYNFLSMSNTFDTLTQPI